MLTVCVREEVYCLYRIISFPCPSTRVCSATCTALIQPAVMDICILCRLAFLNRSWCGRPPPHWTVAMPAYTVQSLCLSCLSATGRAPFARGRACARDNVGCSSLSQNAQMLDAYQYIAVLSCSLPRKLWFNHRVWFKVPRWWTPMYLAWSTIFTAVVMSNWEMRLLVPCSCFTNRETCSEQRSVSTEWVLNSLPWLW